MQKMTTIILTVLFLASLVHTKTLYVIDIGHETEGVTLGEKLAVLACQGLMNRQNGSEGEEVAVYTIKGGWDQQWLETTLEQDTEEEDDR